MRSEREKDGQTSPFKQIAEDLESSDSRKAGHPLREAEALFEFRNSKFLIYVIIPWRL